MDKYLKLVGRIMEEIDKCEVRRREAEEQNDFEKAHFNIWLAEILRQILDETSEKHFR